MRLYIENISKVYKRRTSAFKWVDIPALKNISYEFDEGTIYGVIGPSGSGKTTLANISVLYDRPDSGSVYYGNKEVTRMKPADLKSYAGIVRYVFQDPYTSLEPLRTVGWHIDTAAQSIHIVQEEAWKIATYLGMPESRYRDSIVEDLSGGQRQRLAFIIAMIADPAIIILDEPFSMLDSYNSMFLLNYLRMNKKGRVIIYIDQNIGKVLYVADRILVMDNGSIVEDQELSGILSTPSHETTKKLLKSYRKIYDGLLK
ncbi:ABC transport system ATP-binding protein A1A2 [Thermoplasma volcanium GSS1]|uniref:ABC transport system ATP-binding protein A1A2 n=1 Tax=Thermoplasma volcanium (strain ATCC 51530 / DSM 4299 / JCM 9571 / NBRC 15438 / GSS1) TaxID=273116 RepID=Q97BE4_THEVO|nr:ABC transporter ATP-binding protein [Thermoplasma volcanium]BAB59654.1 ABC transport system ATP-binding protein A1A2 [Thermoplasma volcanium GSS1]